MLGKKKKIDEFVTVYREFASLLSIKRDKKLERFFSINGRGRINANKLRERSPSYLTYYKKRKIDIGFKEIDCIVCRIMASYMVDNDPKKLNNELKCFEFNEFCEKYARNRIEELGLYFEEKNVDIRRGVN